MATVDGPAVRPLDEQERGRVLEALLTSDDAMLITRAPAGSHDHRVVYVNDAHTERFGWPLVELLGKPVGFAIGAETEGPVLEQMLVDIGVHGVAEAELTLHHRDGTPVRTLVRFQRVPSGDDDLLVARHLDLTARLDQERWFQALIERVTDLILVVDAEGLITYVSPACEAILGYRPEDGIGRRVIDFLDRDRHPDYDAVLADVVTSLGAPPGDPRRFGLNVIDVHGRTHLFETTVVNLLDDPAVRGLVAVGRDETARHRDMEAAQEAERQLAEQAAVFEGIARGAPLGDTLDHVARLLEATLDHGAVTIGLLDDDGVIRHRRSPTVPDHLTEAFSASAPTNELGRLLRTTRGDPLVLSVDDAPPLAHLRTLVEAEGIRTVWVHQLRAPGDERLLGLLAVLRTAEGPPDDAQRQAGRRAADLASIAVDRHAFEDRLRHQAHHDALTGLPNRQLLLSRVDRLLGAASGGGAESDAALLFVDLDQFKVINDSLGHAAGDDVLDQVAERFRSAVRPEDFVGRFGGDEFVVLCEEVGGEEGAVAIARRLAVTLERPFRAAGAQVVLSCSIGIALVTDPDLEAEALIRNADAAMYRAKELGRDNWVVFEDHLHARAVKRMQLEQRLRSALADGEVTAWFQPQVRLADGRITGVEALARWERPGQDPVPPQDFIPVAEETGLIVELGRQVLDHACRAAAAWRAETVTALLPVTVNLAARQLTDPALSGEVHETLHRYGLPPEALCFEVTESALVNDLDRAVAALEHFRGLGVRLSIDDFGTGYATLEHVRRFSMAHQLKVDQVFVAGLPASRQDRAIVSASVVLARSLGMSVVAEGVETEAQRQALVELGCELGQGYLFSRPVPASALPDLLRPGSLG